MGNGKGIKKRNKKTKEEPTIALEVIIVILLKPAAESVLTKMPEDPQQAPAISGIKKAILFICTCAPYNLYVYAL